MEKLFEKFPEIREAWEKPSGAHFYKCALQVNFFDYGHKYRGKAAISEDDFNQRLAASCIANGVQVVGIADHGNVNHIEKLRDVLTKNGIAVFPGFEISSSEKIHMVCLFDPTTSKDKLNQYLGALGTADSTEEVAPSSLTCKNIAKKVLEHGGVWYAAHLTSTSGLLRIGGGGDNYKHIWQDDKLVLAGQIPGPIGDLPANYQNVVLNKNPDYLRTRPIAVLNAQDLVEPDDLAKPSTSCFIKMTEPSIEALKQAFYDPESRIRLNHYVEQHSQSQIVLASWLGGFLDGIQVHFSENLNAIIGGRGAGKSTMLETLRYCLEISPKGKEAKSNHENIVKASLGDGGRILLLVQSQKQMNKRFVISRRYGEDAQVFSDDGKQSNLTPIDLFPGLEIYGQNEILEISRPDGDLAGLMRRFLPENLEEQRRILELRKGLEVNRTSLLAAKKEWDEVASHLGQLSKLTEQEKNYKSLGLDKKIENIRKLARGDQLFKRAKDEVAIIHEKIADLKESLPFDLAYLSEEALKELPNAETFIPLREALDIFGKNVSAWLTSSYQALEGLEVKTNETENSWKDKKSKIEAEVDQALKALPDFAGKPGQEVGRQFVQIQKQIESILPMQKNQERYLKLIQELEAKRRELLFEWSEAHNKQYHNMRKVVDRINSSSLKGKLRIDLQSTGDRTALKNFLSKLEGVGQKKIEWVDKPEQLLINSLVSAIRAGEDALSTAYKEYGMSPALAKSLSGLEPEKIYMLEEIQLHDSVQIRLNVAYGNSEEFKSLNELSTGQRCTAILHLLMLENEEPLLVDQPEDNLDNAFIADRIVTEMREQKCKRQFLFATHNPNIPVFGDAEWIGVLESESRRAFLRDENVGSIDKGTVQTSVEQILEGGRFAFETRRLKYGF